jgi:hypothetical protein
VAEEAVGREGGVGGLMGVHHVVGLSNCIYPSAFHLFIVISHLSYHHVESWINQSNYLLFSLPSDSGEGGDIVFRF